MGLIDGVRARQPEALKRLCRMSGLDEVAVVEWALLAIQRGESPQESLMRLRAKAAQPRLRLVKAAPTPVQPAEECRA